MGVALPLVFPQYAVAVLADTDTEIHRLPENITRKPYKVRTVTVTAYSSTIDQTDSTPFITANQTRVRWGIVATNFLPFNSKISFSGYFDDQLFTVTDRTHPRFGDRVDIWFPTREEALQFGKRKIEIEMWRY